MSSQPGFTPHITSLGQGARKALALHCTMAFSGAWAGVSKACPDLTLIAPDMPSHGRSPNWDGHSSFADTVLTAALDCLTEPMDLVGHSFGGAIALRIAVEYPEMVRSLTMIEPVFFCVGALDVPDSTRAHDEGMQPIDDAMKAGDFETAARLFNRLWGGTVRWAQLPEQVRAAMAHGVQVVPSQKGFLIDDSNGLMPRLSEVAVPSLLVHGETSLDIVKTTNAGITRRFQNAETVEMTDAGHMAPITHPQEFAQLWQGFLNGVAV